MTVVLPEKVEKYLKDRDRYEWKAMSEWLEENKDKKGRIPGNDGWEIYWGALRRPKK